jgi:hypothetical protein
MSSHPLRYAVFDKHEVLYASESVKIFHTLDQAIAVATGIGGCFKRVPYPGDRFIHRRYLKPDARPPFSENSQAIHVVTAIRRHGTGLSVFHISALAYDAGHRNGSHWFSAHNQEESMFRYLPYDGSKDSPDIPRFGSEEDVR